MDWTYKFDENKISFFILCVATKDAQWGSIFTECQTPDDCNSLSPPPNKPHFGDLLLRRRKYANESFISTVLNACLVHNFHGFHINTVSMSSKKSQQRRHILLIQKGVIIFHGKSLRISHKGVSARINRMQWRRKRGEGR